MDIVGKLNTVINASLFEDKEREIEVALYHLSRFSNNNEVLLALIEDFRKGVPIANQIGYTTYKECEFMLGNKVLTPGLETFILLNNIEKHIKKNPINKILDLCTGSGIFAITIAKFYKCQIFATDISEDVLNIAKKNANNNNCDISFIKSDMLESKELADMKFDIIISNPPYVKTGEIHQVPNFVRNYAPKLAIDGGVDGLFFHKEILKKSNKFLENSGVLFLECEEGQFEDIYLLTKQHNWKILEKYSNKYGIIRGIKLSKC